MRFDRHQSDAKEEHEFIEAILEDVRWLGFDWGSHLYFASDHFERLYEWAEHLIQSGDAYVDDLSAEEMVAPIAATLTEPGRDSPYRARPAAGEPGSLPPHAGRRRPQPEGARVLAGEDRHGVGQHQHAGPAQVLYRILHALRPTRAPARTGASTPPTISRTGSRTRSRA